MNIILKKQLAMVLLVGTFSVNNQMINAISMRAPANKCGCTQQPQSALTQPMPTEEVKKERCGCNKPKPVVVVPQADNRIENKCGCGKPRPVAIAPVPQLVPTEEVKNEKCGCNRPKPAVAVAPTSQPQPELLLNKKARREAVLARCCKVLVERVQKLPCDSELKEMIMEIMLEQELEMAEVMANRSEIESSSVNNDGLTEIKNLLEHCCHQQNTNSERIIGLLQTIIVALGQCCG